MSEKMPARRLHGSLPFRLKALSAVVLSTALLTAAHGASLGRINVLSALGQPLQAEIELHSTTREQAENLKIRLASLETFRVANIEYNPVLSALRFNVEERSGKPVIRVSSTRPINEPFVDLLLEVEGSGGRLVREYTFILDPVDLRKPQPVQMAASTATPAAASTPVVTTPPAPAPVAKNALPPASVMPATVPVQEPAAARQEIAPAPQRAAPAARQTPQPVEANTESVKEHTIVRGDTLGKIAREVAPDGVSLDQMLVALHRANPQAFVDDNMNRLRTGRILTVPDAEEVRAVPEAEARKVVIAQANDFNLYKERLASQVAAAAPVASEAARQSASGRITTQVEELGSPTASAQDRLQLSKSGVAVGRELAGAIPAGAEERIAQEKALSEANARIAELEKNLTAMQRLLQLRNQELADRQAQSQAEASKQAAAPVVAPVAASAAEQAAAAPDASVLEKEAAVAPSEETPAAATEPAQPAPVVEAAKPVVAPPPIVEEPSFVEHMLEHPLLLPLTGVLGALGVLGVVMRRRRKQQEALARDSFVQGNSLFGSTGGQSVDTNNSVFSTNFSPSASQLDTNEVDPIAEADVYIAYQKDDQAEEILKDALRTHPARHNVRLKLLDIYQRRKDAVAFAACAHEMYGLTQGSGEDWLQAAMLGRELDPDNPLYAESAAQDGESEQLSPSTEELDLGALLNSTRMPAEEQSEGSLTTEPGGMSFDAAKDVAADEPLAFDFSSSATENAETPSEADASLADWDVDSDIAQIKAEAEQETSDVGFPSADAKDAADDDLSLSFENQGDAADKPLDFDISDISLELDANNNDDLLAADLGEQDSSVADPLAELVPTASKEDASFDEADAASVDNSFSLAAQAKPESVPHIVREPLLDLDIPTLPKPGESDQDDLNLSLPAGGVGLGDEGQMWEDSQDEIALAQATLPLPSIGPISAETELSTKLDLAVAYREIGDKEGARELLEEVLASGHPEYTSKAQDLLEKIT